MHPSIKMNPAPKRQWNRAAIAGLAGIASFLLPALCQAQTPPIYTVTTVAGTVPANPGNGAAPTVGYTGDAGAATSAELNGPTSVALDSKGNIYIADQTNNVIRMVLASSRNISTVAGMTTTGYSGDAGPATSAEINYPDTMAVDSKGNFYFSDVLNGAVRMVTPAGIISPVAGSSVQGVGFSGDGALATQASLDQPSGIAIDSAGNIYIADSGNFRIRKVTASTGDISTIAGSGTEGLSLEGGAALAVHLSSIRQLALAANGDLYFADSLNNQIRKLSNGVVSIVAGNAEGLSGFSGDEGLATNALLDFPTGVAVDASGNVYIGDTTNARIRMVTPDGIIHTIAGMGTLPGYGGDGGPALSAQFNEPISLIVDASGNLYVADYGNDIIRKLTPSAPPSGPGPAPVISGVISASGFGALSGIAPGSWIEIYGTNLAPTTRTWATTDFTGNQAPTQLNLTTVSVGGQSAFVEYISPTQVNALVPGTIGLGTQSVTVNTAAGPSAAFNINATLEEPGLFAPTIFKIVGKQYVGALFTDNTTYVFPTGSFAGITSRAAQPGETIVIYGTGFGAVPGYPPGQIPQAVAGCPQCLSVPLAPKFYFGVAQAQVQYAGLVAGAVGLYQFNVIVPAIAANNAVPLTFTVNVNGTDVAGTQTLYTAVQ